MLQISQRSTLPGPRFTSEPCEQLLTGIETRQSRERALVQCAGSNTVIDARVVAAALLHTTAALDGRARLPLQPSGKVVILGGGLQGCASAYYLKQRGFEDVTIVERTSVAAAASGKGGGFLARGWGSGPTRALHEVSFDLHAELAKTLNLKTYRKIKTLSVTGELGLRGWPPADKPAKAPFSPDAPAWLDKEDTGAKLPWTPIRRKWCPRSSARRSSPRAAPSSWRGARAASRWMMIDAPACAWTTPPSPATPSSAPWAPGVCY